ncbi:hypothetical protein GDO86_004474 [Hymenochirus boettgeri]|uniref:Tensin-2 n=1 Tax=Hymenochirus boettgeri TaxID=247094 RepID=A0A8T2K7Z3_9PIPI|nr:hypothetical protein GDO86_004474 [Hymenochirus boettgeri]
MGCAQSCGLGGQTTGHTERTMHLTETSVVERHVFQEKTLKKKRLCAACSEPVVSQGSVCRVCKVTSHKKCEGKVFPGCCTPPPPDMRRRTAPGPNIQHMGSTKSLAPKQRSSLPRNFSLDHVIQRNYDLDLTYITERIISVFFPTNLEEQRYRSNLREVASMLRSKHEDKYLLFNLSRKRHDISKLNPKVQEYFWPDCHAPPLDVICSICKAIESWLAQDPQHVVVLLCKGNQGKTGVVIASYMHYSKVSASVDQALTTLAMRKFCEDKVAVCLHPSQRRYINYFGGLLSGNIKISSDMLSLQCVLLPVIPALQTDEGFSPFLKIYQSMQLVYTSGIYLSLEAKTQKRQLCISLEPALLLKGDIMVKCYHKRCKPHEREVLFRVQFHTCTIHNTHLCFSKDQLDSACTDDRFPEDAAVEFIFSSGHDKSKGREVFRNDPAVSVDYDITDPLVRFDSYENLNMDHEDSLEDLSHTRGPLDGSLYARVKKKSITLQSNNGSPEQNGRLLSVSSDSGHSSAPTEKLEDTPQKSIPTPSEREDLEKLLGGFGVSVKQEGETHYSQVLKNDVTTQNVNQTIHLDERAKGLQHQVHQERINQNIQTKINGDIRPLYSSIWPGMPDRGATQCLPLVSSSWEDHREAPCEARWEGQREATILEEEIGQFGGLAVYPGRRPLVSRHCSCRLGYTSSGPNVEGPPNRSYFRPDSSMDSRGGTGAGVILQPAQYPGVFEEQDRRRLFRSLSEGPQHYSAHVQGPPKRGSLRDTRPYICQPPPQHESLFPPLCPCSFCQNSAYYPVTNVQPFHREELSLHIPQTYGQNVHVNHDFPHPFQIPQTKIHYAFPGVHGEDPLHFNHFTESNYGHKYPPFLNPPYIPTTCPPNGYSSNLFSNSVSPYSPPRGQSPPSRSLSPGFLSNSRTSGDTISAGSVNEMTPTEQHQDETHDLAKKTEASIIQSPKHVEVGAAVSSSTIAHTNLSANLVSSPHTSTSSPTNIQGSTANTLNVSVHTHRPAQADAFMFPQSPVHTSTPIVTHCPSASNLLNRQNPGQTSPVSPSRNPAIQEQSLCKGQTYPISPTHSPPVLAQNVSLQPHSLSQRFSTSPKLSATVDLKNTNYQNQGQTSVSPINSPALHVQNTTLSFGQTFSMSPKQSPSVHIFNTNLQSDSQGPVCSTSPIITPPVHMQNADLQNHSQGQTCSKSPAHSPLHTQNPALQSNNPGETRLLSPARNPLHVQNHALYSHDQMPACSISPTHSPPLQTECMERLPSPSATQSLNGQGHKSLFIHDENRETHSCVHIQTNSQLNTRCYPMGTDSPDYAQIPSKQTHNVCLTSEPLQTIKSVHTQSTNTNQISPVLKEATIGQAPRSSQVECEPANTLPENLVQTRNAACTNNSQFKICSTVHTQSHTDTSVQTQIPLIQPNHSMAKESSQVHTHSTVHTQNAYMQTYRSTGSQGSSVQTQKPVHMHAHTSSTTGAERSGQLASCVTSGPFIKEEHTLLPNIPCQLQGSKLLPMPGKPEVTRSQSTFCSTVSSSNGTSASGSDYNSQDSFVPRNFAPLQKRSVTISLPVSPLSPQGKEAPHSPQKSPSGSQCDLLPPSPTPLFPISTAYYSASPCPPNTKPPRLPEKRHSPTGGEKLEIQGHPNGISECSKAFSTAADIQQDTPHMANFVQDSSKFWYKPTISREQAIALLRGSEPGSFLIRDSNSFRGAYGLALKVSSPPPNVMAQTNRGDSLEQLVRHFLIETGPKGVKIKGSPIEPHFGSLSALVSQHSVTPLSLPCRLRIPARDLVEQNSEVMVSTNMSTAADLLRQGAACSVLFLGSVDTESLTGPQAISRASNAILTPPRSNATTVHFKVSNQGITLTDSQRKLFFRRHYPISSVTYCSADPQDRRWTNLDRTTSKVFGFVARKAGTAAENVCHLFAELDPDQPASAIVNFITKVMLGSQKR